MIERDDLDEIVGRRVTNVAINPTSVSLCFDGQGKGGGWLLIQCSYALRLGESDITGAATEPESAKPLLHCLEENITNANFDSDKVLTLFFERGQFLKIMPESDGLESYVLHTRRGIVPIIAF